VDEMGGNRRNLSRIKYTQKHKQTFSWKKWKGIESIWEGVGVDEKIRLYDSRLGTSVSECPLIDNYNTDLNFELHTSKSIKFFDLSKNSYL
jgi:hypothetical protein